MMKNFVSPLPKGEEELVSLLEEGLREVTLNANYVTPLNLPSRGE